MSKHLRGVKPQITADREPLVKAPRPPSFFGPLALAEWKRIMPVLIGRRVICAADLGQIETYCVMAGLVREIETQRQLAGGVIDGRLFGVQNRAAQTARQIAATLGLDPVSRARIATGGDDAPDDDDPLAV
ncbi:P27 family phage terminase small subunit [Pararhodobacter aggregans]